MEKPKPTIDAAGFLASLERRHEEVLVEIDQLADRIEKALLEFKPPGPAAPQTSEGFRALVP